MIKSVLKYNTMYMLEGRCCSNGKEWADKEGRVLCVLLSFLEGHNVRIQLLLMWQLPAFHRPTETGRRPPSSATWALSSFFRDALHVVCLWCWVLNSLSIPCQAVPFLAAQQTS